MKHENNKCLKCGTSLGKNAKFCLECGTQVEKNGKIVCQNCGKSMMASAKFCESCGAKIKTNTLSKDIPWNFDSKIITILFFICVVLGTYLFSSPGFMRWLLSASNGNFFGFVAIIIGAILAFKSIKKEKLDLKKELDNIKKLKLTEKIVALSFLLGGILILLCIGNESGYVGNYVMPAMILFFSFVILVGIIVKNNFEKLSNGINVVAQVMSLGASIISFCGAAYLNNYGNDLNSSYDSQFESFWNNGTANPGNSYLGYSKYVMILGIVFLIVFFVLRTSKLKENRKANIIIAISEIIALFFVGLMIISFC